MATASQLTVGTVVASQQLFLAKPPDCSLLVRMMTEATIKWWNNQPAATDDSSSSISRSKQ